MSKIILCFPVILLSHASNSGLGETPWEPCVGGATNPPNPSAAAPAAMRPRNPRRCVVPLVSSDMLVLLWDSLNRWSAGLPRARRGQRRIRDVRRRVAVRPIVDLVRKIGAGVRV